MNKNNKKDDDFGVAFKRTSKGKHNQFGSEQELMNNDNNIDKAGMGDANITQIGDSYRDMPIYEEKK